MYTFEEVIKYRMRDCPEGIIIDTNLLILLIVGMYNPTLISECGMLNNSDKIYSSEDIEVLQKVISIFNDRVIITPHILAELSNLSISNKGFKEQKQHEYFLTLTKFLKDVKEEHKEISCIKDIEIKKLYTFGFTDLTILEIAKEKNLPVITDDFKLSAYGISQKISVINFQNIKNPVF